MLCPIFHLFGRHDNIVAVVLQIGIAHDQGLAMNISLALQKYRQKRTNFTAPSLYIHVVNYILMTTSRISRIFLLALVIL